MIDVLLISPRLPHTDNRYCGDHAYTDTLLQHPPEGVRYHHYEDLLAAGQMRRIRPVQALNHYLTRWGMLPPDMWFEALGSDLMPNILHIYGFSAVVRVPKGSGPVPTILGSGTGSYSDLKYYLGWDERRIRWARWRKRQYLRLIGAYDSSLRPERADRVLVWSDFSQRMHLNEGYVRPEQIGVLYPGLPWRGQHRTVQGEGEGITFLFVGRDFERKNGSLVLEAFRQVRLQCPAAQLILLGMRTDGQTITERGVTHYQFLPRQELMEHVYPQADVLVLPSRAEGFGLVLLEAMSMGLVPVAVNAWAMPEIIRDGENGLLIRPDSLDDLVDCMTCLAANADSVMRMRLMSKQVFEQRFSVEVHNRQLAAVYEKVLRQACA